MPESISLPGLTYDLWNEIIEGVVDGHAPLFEAMHQVAEGIRLSRELVEELKLKGIKEIESEPWRFILAIELHADEIGGFRISLFSSEDLEAFRLIESEAVAEHGLTPEELESFEIEHGLELDEEIFDQIQERFGISAESKDDEVVFELPLFDSQDIDNSRALADAWDEESYPNHPPSQ